MLKRCILIILIGLIAFSTPPAFAIQYKGDLEANESVTLPEQTSAPTNPSLGKRKLYFKQDGAAYSLDPSGNENPIDRAGLKNYLINGNFDLWQRGTSFTTMNKYCADRWKHGSPGTATVTRQAFALGQTDVPGEPQYFWRNQTTGAGAATATLIRQRIEGARTLAGQTVTWSFWARNDTVKSFQVVVLQSFGTGGTPSGNVTVINQSQSIGTDWTRYIYTVGVPAITGKTVGTDNNDYIEFLIQETSSFSTFILDTAQWQVEKGSVASAFEQRPIGLELVLAQRYFEKSFPLNTTPAEGQNNPPYISVMTITSTSRRGWIPFVARKRTTPTMTYYRVAGMSNDGDWNVREGVSAWTERTTSTNIANENGVVVQVIAVGATAGQGMAVQGHWAADAEL